VTGRGAVRLARQHLREIQELQRLLPGAAEQLGERVQTLQQETSRLRKQVQELKARAPGEDLAGLLAGMERLPGGACLTGELPAGEDGDLRALGDRLRKQIGTGAGLVAVRGAKKTTLLAVVTDDLVEKGGLRADEIVREAASAAGGSGGGKAHLAMAGVADPERIAEALEAGRRRIRAALA
jgi:alanyl-tRNA synthetase